MKTVIIFLSLLFSADMFYQQNSEAVLSTAPTAASVGHNLHNK